MSVEESEELAGLTEAFEDAQSELEDLQTELNEMAGWVDDAANQLNSMPPEHQQAIGQRASGLQGELRMISDPEELVVFGERVQDVFAEPVEEAAIEGLTDIIDKIDLNLPQDRREELREAVRSRAPSDLQTDAEAYNEVLAMLGSSSAFLLDKIAAEIQHDPSRYLIGPSSHLQPLVEHINRRKDSIAELEAAFGDAGDWTPDELNNLQETDGCYEDYETEIQVENIAAEIQEIDNLLNDFSMATGLLSVVSSDVATRLRDTSLSNYQSELNEVASKLSKANSQVVPALTEVDDIITRDDIPKSLLEAHTQLAEAKSSFDSRTFESLASFLGAATTVEDAYEAFWQTVEEELRMLSGMTSQLGDAAALAEKNAPTLVNPIDKVDRDTLRNHPDAAFNSIREHRTWVNEALSALADNLDGDDIRELFERLHSEEAVELDSIDLDTLRELQGTVPIVVSLQR
jgi:DNA repair exonuclease SbcCD ATPase subunit